MVVNDRSITKPDNTQQNIAIIVVVHDTFCIIDNNGCKDNTKQNITTLAVCDTSYTFSMKPDNMQQNMTTTAVKTKHDNHVHKEYIHHKTLSTHSRT